MAKVIAVVNQKGGVGKTTTTVNLAASLAFHGQETLLVDLDPQGNSTSGLGIDKRTLTCSIYHSFLGNKHIKDVIQESSIDFLDVAPSNIDLIGAEVELVGIEGREYRLKAALEPVQPVYKYIFLDCPPSLGLLTLNALCAASAVLIPIQCEYYAMEGLSQLIQTLQRIQQSFNPMLDVEGVVFTMFDGRIKLTNDVMNEVKKVFADKVYATTIPRNVRLAESPSFGKPALLYDFSSRGAQAYLSLAREFLLRNGILFEHEKKQAETQEVTK